MKKRSAYRPREVLLDPLHYILSGFRQVAQDSDHITTQRIKNHAAILAVRTGKATFDDVDALLSAFNIAEALASLGQGADWLPEIRAAQDAMRAAGERPKYLFNGPELTAVNLGMEVHDAQLDDPKTTIALMQKALEIVVKAIRLKKAERIKFEVPA